MKTINVAQVRFNGRVDIPGKSGSLAIQSKDVKGKDGKPVYHGHHTIEFWPFPWDEFVFTYNPPSKNADILRRRVPRSHVAWWEPMEEIKYQPPKKQ